MDTQMPIHDHYTGALQQQQCPRRMQMPIHLHSYVRTPTRGGGISGVEKVGGLYFCAEGLAAV